MNKMQMMVNVAEKLVQKEKKMKDNKINFRRNLRLQILCCLECFLISLAGIALLWFQCLLGILRIIY